MGSCCSRNPRAGAEEAYEEPIITDNNSENDTTVTAIAESKLNNDEVVTASDEVSAQPQAPIAATSNPLVISSISQVELYQTPKRRETVTSRSSVPTVSDDEDASSLMITTSYSTPTMATVARPVPFDLLESVNDD
uniref:Uncharacterized protein n=1 Tax=Amphimedon queenslandica TaxID=400682 RepID=A0A1X7SVU3_AMPQE